MRKSRTRRLLNYVQVKSSNEYFSSNLPDYSATSSLKFFFCGKKLIEDIFYVHFVAIFIEKSVIFRLFVNLWSSTKFRKDAIDFDNRTYECKQGSVKPLMWKMWK